MRIVATEAGDPTPVHDALNEVVALHPILVRRALSEVREASRTQRVVFQSPEILQP